MIKDVMIYSSVAVLWYKCVYLQFSCHKTWDKRIENNAGLYICRHLKQFLNNLINFYYLLKIKRLKEEGGCKVYGSC